MKTSRFRHAVWRGRWRFTRPMTVLAMLFAILHAARGEDSWQVWLDQTAGWDLSANDTIRGGQSFRYSCDSSQLETYCLEAGYARRLRTWLQLGVYYRQQYDKRNGHWREENRPYGDVTLRWHVGYITLSDRNRLEFRMREDQDNTFRFRNKLALQYDAPLLSLDLKPYMAAEGFVDESVWLRESDRMRFSIGIRTDPEKRLLRFVRVRTRRSFTADYYVMHQRTKQSGQWTDEYVAGVQLGVWF